MAAAERVIYLHPQAPQKPATGASCNGCGLCCAAEPCPLGVVLSRRRKGRCAALQWNPVQQRYSCGALSSPRDWLPGLPAAWARRWVKRWIAAQTGCDSELEPVGRP